MLASLRSTPTRILLFPLWGLLAAVVSIAVMWGAITYATTHYFATDTLDNIAIFGTLAFVFLTFMGWMALSSYERARSGEKYDTVFIPTMVFAMLSIPIGSFSLPADAGLSNFAKQARQAADYGQTLLGVEQTPLQVEVARATVDADTTRANKAWLKEVVNARWLDRGEERRVVLEFLTSAQVLGSDATFVAENGVIRPQDEKALFDRAISQARAGNAQAAVWLERQKLASR